MELHCNIRRKLTCKLYLSRSCIISLSLLICYNFRTFDIYCSMQYSMYIYMLYYNAHDNNLEIILV